MAGQRISIGEFLDGDCPSTVDIFHLASVLLKTFSGTIKFSRANLNLIVMPKIC